MLCDTVLTYPLDLMRARLASQVQTNHYRHLVHAFDLMYRKEGFVRMFKGVQPTLQGIIPYAGVNFATFETLKFYAPKNDNGEVPAPIKMFLGGLAGAIGQSGMYITQASGSKYLLIPYPLEQCLTLGMSLEGGCKQLVLPLV